MGKIMKRILMLCTITIYLSNYAQAVPAWMNANQLDGSDSVHGIMDGTAPWQTSSNKIQVNQSDPTKTIVTFYVSYNPNQINWSPNICSPSNCYEMTDVSRMTVSKRMIDILQGDFTYDKVSVDYLGGQIAGAKDRIGVYIPGFGSAEKISLGSDNAVQKSRYENWPITEGNCDGDQNINGPRSQSCQFMYTRTPPPDTNFLSSNILLNRFNNASPVKGSDYGQGSMSISYVDNKQDEPSYDGQNRSYYGSGNSVIGPLQSRTIFAFVKVVVTFYKSCPNGQASYITSNMVANPAMGNAVNKYDPRAPQTRLCVSADPNCAASSGNTTPFKSGYNGNNR